MILKDGLASANGLAPRAADFVIVGAGSAGCALAARLTEDSRNSVILIEAGGPGGGWKVDMPAGVMFLLGDQEVDWGYPSEPDPTIGGRSLNWPAGKMLGGGSSINGQVYIRGTRGDFDSWVAQGCTGWGFDDVLRYFKKSERFEGASPPPSHGLDGPLSVSRPRPTHPLLKTFIAGFHELGLPVLEDYCNGDQYGVFPVLATHRNGRRCSAAKAYLEPARHRANLHIVTRGFARKLILADGRVTGVEVSCNGSIAAVAARREIIVAAGSIGSPALLLRSGIGPGEDLRRIGVAVQLDLAGVGGNLQEHPAAFLNRLVNVPTYNSQTGLYHKVEFGLKYLLSRRGPLSTSGAHGLAFAKTREHLAEPDIQYHFSPALYDFDGDGKPLLEKRPGVLISANVCRPYSRGKISLRDPAPDSRPIIEHQAFRDGRDMETLIAGCRLGDRVFDTAAFRPYVVGRYAPPEALQTDEQWASYIRKKLVYAFHPVGTCRMGSGPDAVVDPSLKVRGIDGLRVADASIMPTLVSANTNAACIMIGEKLADMIRMEKRT